MLRVLLPSGEWERRGCWVPDALAVDFRGAVIVCARVVADGPLACDPSMTTRAKFKNCTCEKPPGDLKPCGARPFWWGGGPDRIEVRWASRGRVSVDVAAEPLPGGHRAWRRLR